jgi:hypothetical protein
LRGWRRCRGRFTGHPPSPTATGRPTIALMAAKRVNQAGPRIARCRCGDRQFIAEIDDWWRKQPDPPNRTEAIRRMVAQVLASSRKR